MKYRNKFLFVDFNLSISLGTCLKPNGAPKTQLEEIIFVHSEGVTETKDDNPDKPESSENENDKSAHMETVLALSGTKALILEKGKYT